MQPLVKPRVTRIPTWAMWQDAVKVAPPGYAQVGPEVRPTWVQAQWVENLTQVPCDLEIRRSLRPEGEIVFLVGESFPAETLRDAYRIARWVIRYTRWRHAQGELPLPRRWESALLREDQE